jgi:glucokinase
MKTILGIDIGGTKIQGILWKGKIVSAKTIATPKNKKAFIKSLVRLIQDLRNGQKIGGIGLAVAGVLDWKNGVILKSPNLKFLNGVRLGSIITRQVKLPVCLENDTKCFLLGEARFGQAKNKKNVVALTLGTGVGGAVLADGKLMRGAHGAAGELGHMLIEREIGRLMTLEDLVSSHGFSRLGVFDPRKGSGEIYQKIGRYLGVALGNLVNIFNPELIILGGGIAKAGTILTKPALVEMEKHALLSRKYLPQVRVSRLEYAGALGAVSLFLNGNWG